MYDMKNLTKTQLKFLYDNIKEIQDIYIFPNSDALHVVLDNGADIQIKLNDTRHKYVSIIADTKNGFENHDDIGKDTIIDAIKSQIAKERLSMSLKQNTIKILK